MESALDRMLHPRMPWHDIHIQITGKGTVGRFSGVHQTFDSDEK